jgi:hypothetical protein
VVQAYPAGRRASKLLGSVDNRGPAKYRPSVRADLYFAMANAHFASMSRTSTKQSLITNQQSTNSDDDNGDDNANDYIITTATTTMMTVTVVVASVLFGTAKSRCFCVSESTNMI